MNYDDHDKALDLLKLAQEADEEQRERAREERRFLLPVPGAQWDDYWWEQCEGKPRYTFDLTSPVIKQVTDEMEQKDFSIGVEPAGGDSTDEIALRFDGLMRTIQNLSDADMVYDAASKSVVVSGFDGWEIRQEYVNPDAFEQDLTIRPVRNFLDRVWFDHRTEEVDARDARHVFKLTAIPSGDFEEKYKRSGKSLSLDKAKTSVLKQKDVVVCGEIYYIKEAPRTLGQFSDGSVFDIESDDYKKVADELTEAGITLLKTRKTKKYQVFIRKFDAEGWLDEAQPTVFDKLPIIPMYGNFQVVENRVVYHGEVAPLMDPQKVFNYAKSREVEEGALAPREKLMMTAEQAAGHDESLQTMNTNADPVQLYNHVDNQQAPYKIGGPNINPHLQNLSTSMADTILGISGRFAAAQGDNPGLQSGVAIEQLQEKSSAGSSGYIRAREIAQARTYQVLLGAIPKVYDTVRQVLITGEDGSKERVFINKPIYDNETNEFVELIDFSQGIYDVTCKAGPGFRTRQDETVKTITEVGKVVPGAVEMNADIVMNSVNAPGMTEAAERVRRALLVQGTIPEDQMTEDEKQFLKQRAQEQQEPDAMMVAAQAEMEKAKAAQEQNQIKFAEANARLAERELKVQQAQFKLMQDNAKIQLQAEQEAHQRQMDQVKAQLTQAQTQGQVIENRIKVEELRLMPTEKLIELANSGQSSGARADFVFDPQTRRIRGNGGVSRQAG
jgi:hypothetical protein